MNWYPWILVTALALAAVAFSATAHADTASCGGKRAWQRDLVEEAVHDWFHSEARPESLLHLIQAEHGIAACGSRAMPARLHTATLPHGIELDRLGAALLANELEWRGVMPRPESGLAGEYFRVSDTRHTVGLAE
jgi:hypothetical protein